MKNLPSLSSRQPTSLNNHGMTLVMALVLMVVVSILITNGMQMMQASYLETKQHQSAVAEAEFAAQAGLNDALSWFRSQPGVVACGVDSAARFPHPDLAFYPREAAAETEDEQIGLVRTFPLSTTGAGRKFARYEVLRHSASSPSQYPRYNAHPVPVQDITGSRLNTGQRSGEGIVWTIESKGYIYIANDGDERPVFDPAQTKINGKLLATVSVTTEIMQLLLNRPINAPCIVNGSNSNFANGTVIEREDAGACEIAYFNDAPHTDMETTPTLQHLDTVPTPYAVFGMSADELKQTADYILTAANEMPSLGTMFKLFYFDGNATFTRANRLEARGILFVNGDLRIENRSNSTFSGLIYCTGHVTIDDGCVVSGCIIAEGGLSTSTAGYSRTTIYNDSAVLRQVVQQVCKYREIRSLHHVVAAAR